MADPVPNLAERLKNLEAPMKQASSEGGGFAKPDPGTYQAISRRIRFGETKKGALFAVLECEPAADMGWDDTLDLFWMLEPHVQDKSLTPDQLADRLSWLKRDLKKFGVPVDDDDWTPATLSPGSDTLEQLMDRPVELEVKHSGDYVNIYLNYVGEKLPPGSVGGSDVTPAAEALVPAQRPVAPDDDIPF